MLDLASQGHLLTSDLGGSTSIVTNLNLHRVQRAIERKDEALVELRRNYERALEQCNHLETMLQLQTKNAYIRNLKNI